jgi:hypothetical protein
MITSVKMPIDGLHPSWVAAFKDADTPLQIWLKQPRESPSVPPTGPNGLPTQPQVVTVPRASPLWPTTSNSPAAVSVLGGVASPLTTADLQDSTRLRTRVNQLCARLTDRDAATRISAQFFSEASSDFSDLAKLQHQEWHSGLDLPIAGFAFVSSSLELSRAFQKNDETLKVLCGAQVGANAIDLLTNLAERATNFGGGATIHSCCLVVRVVAGIAKICIGLKKPD